MKEAARARRRCHRRRAVSPPLPWAGALPTSSSTVTIIDSSGRAYPIHALLLRARLDKNQLTPRSIPSARARSAACSRGRMTPSSNCTRPSPCRTCPGSRSRPGTDCPSRRRRSRPRPLFRCSSSRRRESCTGRRRTDSGAASTRARTTPAPGAGPVLDRRASYCRRRIHKFGPGPNVLWSPVLYKSQVWIRVKHWAW